MVHLSRMLPSESTNFLLSVHLCLQITGCDADGKRGVPEDTSCSEPERNPHIFSPSSETTLGAHVTIECSSNSCLPINFVLFLNKSTHAGGMSKTHKKVIFNLTINSINELGEYKCKTNTTKGRYSSGFSFTLREQKKNVGVPIVLLSLMLLVLVIIGLAILLLILFRRKARKLRKACASARSITANYPDSENCPTYDDTAYRKNEEIVYFNVMANMENNGNVIQSEESTVTYAEVIIRR
ncbi:uncharacterized protein LOC123033129 [Varanus komodoensis]|uniref:uncharacterized protein LOC123033129 n=1 Tax=Varanus komodoensis TaxID=61221 RepID=UPI001CF781C6|nr:uncharacterized protein LOC123033129 [Varanus komodoensis]